MKQQKAAHVEGYLSLTEILWNLTWSSRTTAYSTVDQQSPALADAIDVLVNRIYSLIFFWSSPLLAGFRHEIVMKKKHKNTAETHETQLRATERFQSKSKKHTHRHTSKYFIYLIYSIIVFLSIYSLAIYLSVCLFACLSVYLCICSQYKRKTLHQNSWNSDSDRESCDCWIQAILGGKDWGRQGGRWQQQWLLEHVVRIQLPTQRSTVISRLMRSLPLGVRFRV